MILTWSVTRGSLRTTTWWVGERRANCDGCVATNAVSISCTTSSGLLKSCNGWWLESSIRNYWCACSLKNVLGYVICTSDGRKKIQMIRFESTKRKKEKKEKNKPLFFFSFLIYNVSVWCYRYNFSIIKRQQLNILALGSSMFSFDVKTQFS